jgi:hypothetical protein
VHFGVSVQPPPPELEEPLLDEEVGRGAAGGAGVSLQTPPPHEATEEHSRSFVQGSPTLANVQTPDLQTPVQQSSEVLQVASSPGGPLPFTSMHGEHVERV